jgi:hypothetical protein
MIRRALPRFVRAKRLASGAIAFYWELTGHYRRLGCTIPGEPLGDDYLNACGADGAGGRAAALNALFDEWHAVQAGEPIAGLVRFGTVDWLFREYKQTKAYLEKVSKRSRRDYERTMLLVADIVTKKGDRIGNRSIKAITPVSADKIYDHVIVGPRGLRQRQGEKVLDYVLGHGALFIDFIPRCSIETSRTHGAALPKIDAPKRSNQRPPEIRYMHLRTWQSRLDTPRLVPLR